MSIITQSHSELAEAVAALRVTNTPITGARNEVKNDDSTVPDSGYASQTSTPDSLKSTFVERATGNGKNIWPLPFRKPKQLRPFNKPIPQLTWERFSDLREQYAENLNSFTRSLPNCPSALMTLQVLGESEDSAAPWVFVQCDKAVFKKISNFFKQPMIKADFEPLVSDERSPSLRVLVCPLKPRQLAMGEDPSPRSAPTSITEEGVVEILAERASLAQGSLYHTLCGTRIMAGQAQATRKATVGGIIMLTDEQGDNTLFGMTAGHFLLQETYDEEDDEIREDLSDGFCSEEFELDFSAFDATELEETFAPAHAWDSLSSELDMSNWSRLGRLSEASHETQDEDKNMDWALITLDDPKSLLQGLEICGPALAMSSWTVGIPKSSDTDVFVWSAGGLISGTISSHWSYLMLPPGRTMVRTYTLTLAGPLQTGDSGSWVIDEQSNVYGHVVASDAFGHAYVIPISDSFEDIKTRLCVDIVSFPSASDVAMFDILPHEAESPVDLPIEAVPELVFNNDVPSTNSSPWSTLPREDPQPLPHASAYDVDEPSMDPWAGDGFNDDRVYSYGKFPKFPGADSGYSSMQTSPNSSPRPPKDPNSIPQVAPVTSTDSWQPVLPRPSRRTSVPGFGATGTGDMPNVDQKGESQTHRLKDTVSRIWSAFRRVTAKL